VFLKVLDMTEEPKITQALQLLSMIKEKEVPVKEAVEVIELVTSVPELIRKTLERAEAEGLIKREKGKIVLKFSDETFEFGYPRIKKIKCDDRCKRCGKKITSCYYLLLPDTEIGPFGSKCIKKLRLAV
jgi:hypothetical protein